MRALAWDNLVDFLHCPTTLQLADIDCAYKGGPQYHTLRKYQIECARSVRDDHDVLKSENNAGYEALNAHERTLYIL